MPKIGKNHLIKKPKLVKTTTFATLLIAATLIFSSLAPAAMISNEENIVENVTEPLIAGADSGIFGPDGDEPEMMHALEKTNNYEGSYRGVIIYDNGMFFDTICCSMEDTAYGLDCHQADDFIFAEETKVHDVHWVAGYWNGVTTASSWGIQFYEDDGGVPGAIFAGPFTIEWDDIAKVSLGGEYWEFSANIDEVVFSGGQKYWLDIWGNLDVFPQCGWGAHYYTLIGSQALWGSDYFGFPYWTPGVDVLGVEHDMAFQLTQKPEHDVAVTDIITPYDEQELCGCLPVAIEVANLGIHDEEDVPVFVEIRRTFFTDSFEDPLGFVWDTFGVDCGWSITSFDSGSPSVVTPRTGSYMAELNSGAGGAGGYCYLYEVEYENLEEYCNPWLSFYMWHDTYGSDDYIDVWVDDGAGLNYVAGPFERLCCPGCEVGWKEHKVSLAAYAGLPFISIVFMGHCDPNPGAYNLFIDDVSKYDQEYYAETTVDLATGETLEIEFDEEWCPCLYGEVFNTFMDFEILACTALDIDQVPENDCLGDMITLYFPFEIDVAAIEITEPVQADPGPYEMCGIIKNVGQTDQSCFKAKMNVHELGDLEEIYLQDFQRTCSPYYEWPPVGWFIDTHGFYSSSNWGAYCYYSYTGSASGYPEARFYWYPYADGSWIQLVSEPIDTTGYVSLQIEFDNYLNHFSGPYTLSLQASTDLVEWTNVWEKVNPTGYGATHETIETDFGAGETIYLAFSFEGNQYNLNYWYVDDLKVSGITMGDSIWYDEVCVEELAVCEELEVCFDDFVPPYPWPDCETKKYAICLSVNPCDPIDQNPANNQVCEVLEVEFFRDILVQGLSAPCPAVSKGDLMYAQPPYTPSDSWSFATSDVGLGYLCMDDFSGVTDRVGEVVFWGLSLTYSGGWTPCDPSGIDLQVIFYDTGMGVLSTHDIPNAGLTIEYYDNFAGYDAYKFTVPISGCANNEGEGWISIQSTATCSMLWSGTPDPIQGSAATQNGGALAYDLAFELYACDEEGPPPVDCYIGCGEADITAIIENAGTHDEVVDIYFELYEWITDPYTGTLVMTDLINNVAIASGDTYEANFGTYDFAESGVYGIVIQAPLAGDCDPDNNEDFFGIGVDCCYPHSCHMPDPQYPDGENNWYTQSVDVTIEAFDPLCPDPCLGTASGIKEIHYIIDGGSEVVVPGEEASFKLTADGVHLVEYWAVDNAGNVEPAFTFEIAIDKTAPTVTLLYNVYQDESGGWKVDFDAAASDATSGVSRVEFFIGSTLERTDSEAPFDWSIDWNKDYKTQTFKAVAYDSAGNDNDDTVPGSEIAKEINAAHSSHSSTHTAHPRTILNQQPLSR